MSTYSTEKFPAGWAWPGAARKAHYFAAGETVSVCGRWWYVVGEREPETGERSPSDCVVCVRKLPTTDAPTLKGRS